MILDANGRPLTREIGFTGAYRTEKRDTRKVRESLESAIGFTVQQTDEEPNES